MFNKVRIHSALLSCALMFAGVSVQAQVVGSQHDLTNNGTGQGGTANTDQVCVFCHTPHGADTDAPVPLWNKVLGAGTTPPFTRYSSLATPSFDSAEAPVGSVSLACLSCHDGTQAMDVVINGPGSGNYNPAGSEIDTGAIGVMTGSPVPMLGTDLSNDHPISMQYGGGGDACRLIRRSIATWCRLDIRVSRAHGRHVTFGVRGALHRSRRRARQALCDALPTATCARGVA